jgi:hypothetical protein
MTHNLISRVLFFLISVLIAISLLIGCGGASRNPTNPGGFGDKKEGMPGPGGETGKGNGTTIADEQKAGAPEIKAGATYDELLVTAKTSLEGGFIKTATEAYMKAYDENQEHPEAALAYAILKLAGSPKEMAVLMQPGIDFFYYSTPLIGRWELLPAPAANDSYFLRVLSLGAKYNTRNIIPKAPGGAPPAEQKPTTPSEETTQVPAGGGTSTIPPSSGNPAEWGIGGDGKTKGDGGTTGERTSQVFNEARSLSQDGGPGLGGSTGGTKIQYDATGGAAQQATYLKFDEDIFPAVIKEYQDITRTYSASYLDLQSAKASADNLLSLIDDLITKLERGKRDVEEKDFALEIPFKLDDKPNSVYAITFKNYDYLAILGYLKVIQGELKYQSAYQSGKSQKMLYLQPEDKNTDNILSPDEYYPEAPFGEMIDKGNDTLTAAQSLISDGCGLIVNNLDKFYKDERLASFTGNIVMPVNHDQFLLDELASERDYYSDFQVFLTTGTGKREVTTLSGKSKVDVQVINIFGEKAPKSVKALLPNLDAKTFDPVKTPEGNNFPDPTWGGIFVENFDDFSAFKTKQDVNGRLSYQDKGLKDVTITTQGGKSGKSNDKGEFTIKDVEMNELIGVKVSCTAKDFDTPIDAQLRSAWVAVNLDMVKANIGSQPASVPGGESGIVTTPGGDSSSATGAGGNRIKSVIEEKEKSEGGEKKDESPEEKKGDG